jgi:hypothetical protein
VRVMAHPLLRAHRQTDPDGRYTRLPAYLPAVDVAAALVDVLLNEPTTEQIGQRIDALGPRALGRSLRTLWERSDGDRAAFLAGIAGWYDAQMQRVSGWYKRWSKRWLVVIGALVALVFGIDSVRIAQTLYTEPTVRAAVAAAAAAAEPGTCPEPAGVGGEVIACVEEMITELDQAGLPIGWPAGCPLDLVSCIRDPEPDVTHWLTVLLGLALTTLAASAGAPFWFDTIGRLAPLRNTGGRPRPSR